jgi:hypothetical protein
MVEVDRMEAENLIAQCPLLDGGEGKLQTNNKTINIETEVINAEETGFAGLEPPMLDSTGGVVTGADTPKHRIRNRHKRKATLATVGASQCGAQSNFFNLFLRLFFVPIFTYGGLVVS